MLTSFLKMISAVPKFNIFDKCRADTELPIQIWRLKKATIKKHISGQKTLGEFISYGKNTKCCLLCYC